MALSQTSYNSNVGLRDMIRSAMDDQLIAPTGVEVETWAKGALRTLSLVRRCS